MRRTRVIPVLLIHRGGIYKTRNFRRPTYIGDAINSMRLFNDLEVDELVLLDIDASREKRGPDLAVIQELASEAFMPLAYGGGVTSVDQVTAIVKCGFEKVILNQAVLHEGSLITDCAKTVGSQSVVVAIDFVRTWFGEWRVYDHVRRRKLRKQMEHAAIHAETMGAGEILLNSVDCDGLLRGGDYEAVQSARSKVDIPIIACGGLSSLADLKLAREAGASAVAAGSMFVFHGARRGVLINYPSESDLRGFLD